MVSLMYMSWASYYLYVFIALSITVAGMLVCEVCFRKNSRKRNRFVAPLLCIVMSIGFVALFSWKDMVSLVGGFIRKGENSGLWPNPNTQISELQSVKIFSGQSFWELFVQHRTDFLSYVGGIIPLLFFVVSVVVLLYMAGKGIKGKKWRVQETRELVFLYVSGGSWLIGSFVLLFWGIRFFEFFIMPMAIVLAFGMNVVLEKIPTRRLVYVILSALSFAVLVSILPIWAVVLASWLVCLGFWLGRSKRRTVLAITIVAVVLLPELELSIVKSTHAEPFVNRPIEEALIWIKECTPEDAVLINDWSLGYAYQYYSERRTISDGGFYSGGFLFWAYTMLITDDEKLSAGIAKMLTGDWEEGTEYVVSLCGDTKTAVALMKELLSKTKVEATDYLNRNTEFSKDQKEMMLS